MQATPIEIVQRQRIRIIATMNYEAEQYAEQERKRKDAEREYKRAQQGRR